MERSKNPIISPASISISRFGSPSPSQVSISVIGIVVLLNYTVLSRPTTSTTPFCRPPHCDFSIDDHHRCSSRVSYFLWIMKTLHVHKSYCTFLQDLGQEVGFKDYTLPFLAPTTVGPLVLRGVNYASGGGGILNHTGKIFVGRINLDAQLDNFAKTRQDIISGIGFPAAHNLLNRALFSVTIEPPGFLRGIMKEGCVKRINQGHLDGSSHM
ncbi:hypothetical protein L6452_16401 [Arctium lappa]|uniref:Uncharacterized protein n=1 Tax=Arctium lappa TaxID=4217 RepID=A0ACB9C0I8_ARCLA|nr:hypothetical protein L6452_16401 [Arctium lappa]